MESLCNASAYGMYTLTVDGACALKTWDYCYVLCTNWHGLMLLNVGVGT